MLGFTNLQVSIALAVASAVMFGGWLLLHDAKVAKKTEAKIVERSEAQGRRNADNAKKALDRARKPGAFERLRSSPETCPDCSR